MGFINIDDIVPGMTLSSDLFTREGRFLLPQGKVLNEKTVMTCKAWGITQADIAGHNQNDISEARLSTIDPEFIRQAQRFLKPYLVSFDFEHPAMKEIAGIAVERTARRFMSGELMPDVNRDSETGATEIYRPVSQDNSSKSALRLVREQVNLISLPDIFIKIKNVMESPLSSAGHIADVVGKDSSLTAKLLKLVNSAYFGFPSKIDTIRRAVAILGTRELTSLAFGISVVKIFDRIPGKILNMESFWKHCISCSVYARLISSPRHYLSGERFFVAGLLHDLGRLLMIKSMPEDCLEAIYLSRREQIPLYLAEQNVLGFDHARVGGLLCREWRIPKVLEQMVRFHHEPSKADNIAEAGSINLANLMAMAAGRGGSGEGVFPPLNPTVWDSLGIEPSVLSPMVLQAEKQIDDVIHIILGKE